MDKDQIERLNQIEKYISEEFDKQLNKHWRFFMDPKDPLCTLKVTHVQLLDNYGFLKIKKIYDG